MDTALEIVTRPEFIDYLAPDKSEIRLLKSGEKVGLCECTLGPGAVTLPVRHKEVEEVWYVISGRGTIVRAMKNRGPVEVSVQAGDSIVIPVGTTFQFRAGDAEPLVMILATAPIWDVELEAGGPEPGDEVWRPIPPVVEWRIQGDWWQYAERPDGAKHLARVRIARTGPLTYAIDGKSYTGGWEPRAVFGARNATFEPDALVMRYAWTGRVDSDQYAGYGEILFDEALDCASGYYEMTLGPGVDEITRSNLVYARIAGEEFQKLVEVMGDASQFDKVIDRHFSG